MMTWWRENWRLYRIRCEIWSEINGIVDVTSFWVSSWDRGLLVPYLSLINKIFLVAKTVRLVMPVFFGTKVFPYSTTSLIWQRTAFWAPVFTIFTSVTVGSTSRMPGRSGSLKWEKQFNQCDKPWRFLSKVVESIQVMRDILQTDSAIKTFFTVSCCL